MNKEEAIKKLANIIFDVSEIGDIPYDTEDEQCAMNIARRRIDELFPPFPDNLDEAAKQLYPIITEEAKSDEWKIANREYNDMCIKLRDAFRKGAEWMAEQMKQKQTEVDLEKVAEGVVLKFHPIMRECYAMNLGMHEMIELVKSGFELGLNAIKEENK